MGGAWEALEGSDGALREARKGVLRSIFVFGLASRPHL